MSDKELLNQLKIDRGQRAIAERPSSKRWWLIGAGVVLLVLAVLLYLRPADALEVSLANVTSMAGASRNASVLDATGYVTARRIATVSSQVTGQVKDVFIEEGMQVKAGDVLATLVADSAKAQVDLGNAQMRQAQAQTGTVRAQLSQAQDDLKRQQELSARQLTSQVALEQARTAVAQLSAQLTAAQRGVDVARDGLAVAQVQLDNTTIRAPFGGVITVKAAQPGEMISPISAGGGFTRTGIGTVVDMDSLEIEVDVNEAFINRVVEGQPVEARLNAYPDWTIPARVIATIPTADRTKATVRVRIGIQIKDPRILPDMGVRTSFLAPDSTEAATAPTPRGVLVPSAAIVTRDGKQVVFVALGEIAQMREVSLGEATVGSAQQVLSGVDAGARVVLDPPPELGDGVAIREQTRS